MVLRPIGSWWLIQGPAARRPALAGGSLAARWRRKSRTTWRITPLWQADPRFQRSVHHDREIHHIDAEPGGALAHRQPHAARQLQSLSGGCRQMAGPAHPKPRRISHQDPLGHKTIRDHENGPREAREQTAYSTANQTTATAPVKPYASACVDVRVSVSIC